MTSDHRAIYVAANLVQAHALKNQLAEQGIVAHVTDAGSVDLPHGRLDPDEHLPRIVVHQDDADEALRISLDFDAALREGRLSAELEQLEEEIGDDAQWPACPSCNRPRLTSCPICETAGTDFAEAFLPESLQDESSHDSPARAKRRLVICPTCDEPFAPEFPARCEWCGYRFSDGREPPPLDLGAAGSMVLPELNLRVVAVALGLALVAALVMGWFYYVLNQSGG